VRFLLIDPSGNALDIALRAEEAGHKVKHFIRQDPKTEHIGRGMVEVVDDFRPWLNWADLTFNSDNTKYLVDLEGRMALGEPIVSATRESAAWELDRQVGMGVFKKHGIETLPSKEFNNYDMAIAYVKKHNRRFVSKPSGDADKALSYCAKTPADMVFMLERWKTTARHKAPFILQEFVDGIEMAVGGWFGRHGFSTGWCENFEFKKLMDGDKGVATGEQGTVLRYTRQSKLARKVLKPLEDALDSLGYVGYVDVNCIIDAKGQPWPLEFTMRPGWPTFNIQQELHTGDPIEWLLQLASGKDAQNFLMDVTAIGVVLTVPDYPYSHLTRKEVIGSPIYGITAQMYPHVHFCEVMLGEAPCDREGKIVSRPMPVTAGDYVLVMTAIGQTIYDAKQTAYRRLNRLTLPGSPMWRTDIGDRLAKELPILQGWGYASGMAFSNPP
jgi:phosphoribosylamine---glycine ligase